MMGGLLIVGAIWFIYSVLKEEVFTKQIPKGTDFHQSFLDSNHISGKELNRRLTNGYYVRKDK